MATSTTPSSSKDTKKDGEKAKPGRRTLRKAGRVKRNAKIVADKEFATKYFEAKSKRSIDKKVVFRKKKMTKK